MATTTIPPAADAAVIRQMRRAAGLTQIELARLAGCSLATLRNFEQGGIPERSPILGAVLDVLLNDERRPHQAGAVQDGEAAPHGRS